ncbi:MAG: D-alanyl-D-alanine carboxypeptidase family protein [Culicoidibacterales bacterium]
MIVQAASIPGVIAHAQLLIEAETGEILFAENADEKLPVYSVSKLMTAYITLQAINEGAISWDQQIVIDQTLASISEVYAFTNVPLTVGKSYTVRDLFQAMLVQSANAATMTLAKAISGSETQFATLMNETAKALGLKDSQFVSSSGLEQEDLVDFGIKLKAGGNQMSANDVATLLKEIYANFPEIAKITQVTQMWFDETNETEKFLMSTSNPLLPGASQEIPGFLGGKSGFGGIDGTAAYTSILNHDETTLITVVIGAMNMSDVYEATRQMMEYGLTVEKNVEKPKSKQLPTEKNQDINYDFKVINGKIPKITINFSEFIPKKWENQTKYSYSFTPTAANYEYSYEAFEAPVLENQLLGQLKIKNSEKTVETIPIYANETIEAIELQWWQKIIKIITELF